MAKNKIYKNLPYKKIYLYRFVVLMILISLLIPLFGLLKSGTISLFATLAMLIWTISFYLLPMLILYFNYRSYNKYTILQISNNGITYKDGLQKRAFPFEEIEYVEFNLSYPLYENRWRLAFWDEYYYALVKLKDGEKYIITCLLCDELKEIIPIDLIKKRRRVFPLVQIKEKIKLSNLVNDNILFEKKVQSFIIKFKNKSELELQNIVKSKNEYQSEAVQAAKKLLKLKEVISPVGQTL